MTVEMVTPAWMHQQVTAEQYAAWTEEQCAGIEIVDGMVLVSPGASKRHNRLIRLQDVPLNNRRPDVTVYRADSIDVTPTRPEHVLLVVEVVSPGSETTDGSSRPISTRGPASSSIGVSSRLLPEHRSSTHTFLIRRLGGTATARSSPAS
jgi:hypothetical protein